MRKGGRKGGSCLILGRKSKIKESCCIKRPGYNEERVCVPDPWLCVVSISIPPTKSIITHCISGFVFLFDVFRLSLPFVSPLPDYRPHRASFREVACY